MSGETIVVGSLCLVLLGIGIGIYIMKQSQTDKKKEQAPIEVEPVDENETMFDKLMRDPEAWKNN